MVVIGGGYIGMEVAAATVGWKLDTTVCLQFYFCMLVLFVIQWKLTASKWYLLHGGLHLYQLSLFWNVYITKIQS